MKQSNHPHIKVTVSPTRVGTWLDETKTDMNDDVRGNVTDSPR